jgi:hypothetical protein
VQVVLPVLKEQVARCVHGATPGAVVLTQRAVVGLLRVCTRLLMYRSDVTEELVECIKVPRHLTFPRHALRVISRSSQLQCSHLLYAAFCRSVRALRVPRAELGV